MNCSNEDWGDRFTGHSVKCDREATHTSCEGKCERGATHNGCEGVTCPAHAWRASRPLPGPVPVTERCHYTDPDGRPCDGYRGHVGPHEALWDAPTYQVLRAEEPSGAAAIFGRWPGDETDDEFDRAMRELADQRPTRVRPAESAKVAPCPLCRVPVPKRLPAVGPLDAFAACPGCHAVLVWRASGEWESTGLPTRAPEPSAWQREALPDAPRSAAGPAEGVSSVVLRETSSPESAHASDEAPSHTATPPRETSQAQTSSVPAAAEKRLDTMSGKNDPTTKTTQKHTRRGPSPYPGCTHPSAMRSPAEDVVICGMCGCFVEGLPTEFFDVCSAAILAPEPAGVAEARAAFLAGLGRAA